ncbi:hypothetical protein [Roseateles sp. L2-2]|uniref:hypothetical protein n=1 Tax=Roseateles sp. L2-2 TaxID=3422597 RepID=UPI003D35D85E
MPMIAFFPWMQLRTPLREGRFHVFPVGHGHEMPDGVLRCVELNAITKVLAQYRVSPTTGIAVHTLVEVDGHPIGTDLDEQTRIELFAFAQNLAVSSLASRRFTSNILDRPSCGGHYQLIIQSFTEPYTGGTSIAYRRKGSWINVMMSGEAAKFFLPPHLVDRTHAPVDIGLLHALQNVGTLRGDLKERVRDSVAQFLVANSDSPDIPSDAESLATYAALERLSGASQKLPDLQAKVADILSAALAHPASNEVLQRLQIDAEQDTVRAWLAGLYKLRGHTGHGKPGDSAPKDWLQHDHLLAGAFVYALALKCLFYRHNLYRLRLEDVAHVLGLPLLLEDRPFFPATPAPDQEAAVAAGEAADLFGDPVPRGWMGGFHRVNKALLEVELGRGISAAIDESEQLARPGVDQDGGSQSTS